MDEEPNILQKLFGGAVSAVNGTISPMQAHKMGQPWASGMTPQQMQWVISQPERQQNQQINQQSIDMNKLKLDQMQHPQAPNVKTWQDPASKAWFYAEPGPNGQMVAKPLHAPDMDSGPKFLTSGGLDIASKRGKFIQAEYDKVIKEATAELASSRSAVGIAKINNQRADRALQNINDPTMVFQELNLVTQDVSSMMRGGVGSDLSERATQVNNLKTAIAKLKQQFTSKPEIVNTPEWKSKLKQIILDIKKVDNRTIKSLISGREKAKGYILKYYPEEWKSFKQQELGDLEEMGTQSQGQPGADPLGIL